MQNRYLSSRNPAPLPTGLLATRRWCGWLSCVISRHVHRYWNTRYSKLSQGRRLQKNGAPWALCPLQLFSFSSSIIWRRYSSKGQTKRTARKGLLVLPVALFVFFLFAAHWTNARGLNPSLQVSSLYIWGDALVLHFPGATRPAKHRVSSTVNALFFKTICKAVAGLFSVSAWHFLIFWTFSMTADPWQEMRGIWRIACAPSHFVDQVITVHLKHNPIFQGRDMFFCSRYGPRPLA